MIYFTSDLHLGHKRIIELSHRPYGSVEEMDVDLIARFNSRVGPNDTVYDLGDTYFRNPKHYAGRLNGNIIRLKGSHDHDLKEGVAPRMLVLEPKDLVDDEGNQLSITLCHYAMRSWDRSHYGTWHLYGHHHGRLAPHGLSFDVGVDCWNYYPISLDEVKDIMSTLRPIINYNKKGDRSI